MPVPDPWDRYTRDWLRAPDQVFIEDRTVKQEERGAYLGTIGDEWGTRASVEAVVADFLLPFATQDTVALDLGCGGGRVARYLRPHVGALIGADPSTAMLAAAGLLLPGAQTSRVRISGVPAALPFRRASFDLVYSFDVMVHFESRLIFRYVLACAELLRPGGKLVLHVATTDTPLGLEHFRRSAVAGHSATGFGAFNYQSRVLLDSMGRMAGLWPVLCSTPTAGHFYCERDFLAVFERRDTSPERAAG